MSERSQRDRERELEAALGGFGAAAGDPDDPERAEIDRLASLAGEVRRFGRSVPTIDEHRVWLNVRAGMLAQPQRRPLGFWGTLGAALGSFAGGPRLVMAGTAALVVIGVLASAWVLQPSGSASAAFLHRVDEIAVVSAAAAERSAALSAEDRDAIEKEAFALLELASRPGVLRGLRSNEANAVRDRLIDAREALASILAEDPREARAIAALAAISGLLDSADDAAAGREAQETPTATATPTPPPETGTPSPVPTGAATVAPASATATGTSTATGTASPTSTQTPKATATATATPPTPTRTPTASPTPTATPSGASLAAVQAACARVVDRASLAKCAEAGAVAQRACPSEGGRSCRNAIEELVDSAEHRLERLRADCSELPSSKAREACKDATRSERKRAGSEFGTPSGSGGRSGPTSGGGADDGRD